MANQIIDGPSQGSWKHLTARNSVIREPYLRLECANTGHSPTARRTVRCGVPGRSGEGMPNEVTRQPCLLLITKSPPPLLAEMVSAPDAQRPARIALESKLEPPALI